MLKIPLGGKNYIEGSSKRIDFTQIIDDPEMIEELKDIATRIVI